MATKSWVDEILAKRHSAEEWKEGLHLEFKESREKLTSDLWETYSAFGNTEGGVIVLGVTDGGRIKGVPNPEKQMKDLVNTLNNETKVSLNLCSKPDSICPAKVGGQTLVLIRVPAAEVKDKPVYLNGRTDNCFLRQNESDVRCSKDDVDQMNRDASAISYVPRILPGVGLEAIDRATFAQYRNRMRSYKPEHPWVQLDDLELLARLKGYVTDAATGVSGLTLEGVLMFGTEEAIIRYCPQLQLDYFEYDGEEGGSVSRRWVDRICNDGTWVPNLYQFFFRVLPRLQQRLKNPFRLNADMTAQGESPAHVAVREALANAVVHADYLGVGSVCIRQYPEHLLLENPGTLLLRKDVLMRGGLSRCRNMALQSMFMMMGIAERAGSGIDKMMQGWLDQCLVPPSVEEMRNPARVVWTMPFVGLIPKESEELLVRHFGGERFEKLSLMPRLILVMVAGGKMSSHREIRAMLPLLHSADLTRILSALVADGFLVTKGRTLAASYSVAPNAAGVKWETSANRVDAVSDENDVSGNRNGGAGTSGQGSLNLQIDDAHTFHNGDSTPEWLKRANCMLGADLIAEVECFRATRRGSIEQLERLIVAICDGQWVSLPQLSILLDRKTEYLRRKCVQPMLRHGWLQKMHEDDTHPMQAYQVLKK